MPGCVSVRGGRECPFGWIKARVYRKMNGGKRGRCEKKGSSQKLPQFVIHYGIIHSGIIHSGIIHYGIRHSGTNSERKVVI